jgi:hypothetical protein
MRRTSGRRARSSVEPARLLAEAIHEEAGGDAATAERAAHSLKTSVPPQCAGALSVKGRPTEARGADFGSSSACPQSVQKMGWRDKHGK